MGILYAFRIFIIFPLWIESNAFLTSTENVGLFIVTFDTFYNLLKAKMHVVVDLPDLNSWFGLRC